MCKTNPQLVYNHPNHISRSAIAALTLPEAHAAIIRVVEKVFGATSNLDVALVNLFLQIKRENGYSVSQIDRKRLSLEGVLVPVTARWNGDLLHQEGFTSVDCFWRHLNFAGWWQ